MVPGEELTVRQIGKCQGLVSDCIVCARDDDHASTMLRDVELNCVNILCVFHLAEQKLRITLLPKLAAGRADGGQVPALQLEPVAGQVRTAVPVVLRLAFGGRVRVAVIFAEVERFRCSVWI